MGLYLEYEHIGYHELQSRGYYPQKPYKAEQIEEANVRAAMMKAEWESKYAPQVKALSNKELLDEVIELAGGDDYEGCHTVLGSIVYDLLRAELKDRLTTYGFLS